MARRETGRRTALKSLLAPYPSMTAWPVNARVGNVRNNDPGLMEPIVLR
jgi:putative SOS response-associated peptidase YedK